MNQLQENKLSEISHSLYADVDIPEHEIKAALEKASFEIYEQLLIKACLILKDAGFTCSQRSKLFLHIRENASNADWVNANTDLTSQELDESQDDDITH